MVVEVLTQGKNPAEMAVRFLDNGIATVNTDTAAILGLDYSGFAQYCSEVKELTTAEEFK